MIVILMHEIKECIYLADHDVGVVVCVHWGQISPQGGLVGDHSLYCMNIERFGRNSDIVTSADYHRQLL